MKPKSEKSRSAGRQRKPKLEGIGWATTDADERAIRHFRGQQHQEFNIESLEKGLAPFGRYTVGGESGSKDRPYQVEIRHFEQRCNSCSCVDFNINGLGTCKHIEAVLARKWRFRNRTPGRQLNEIYIDFTRGDRPRLSVCAVGRAAISRLPAELTWLAAEPAWTAATARKLKASYSMLGTYSRTRWRLSSNLSGRQLELLEQHKLARQCDKLAARLEKSQNAAGLSHQLYGYQVTGAAHLIRCGRGILADEMGLGKTIQAIAACEVLHRAGLVNKVLIVSPASLKAEWQDQIKTFTQRSSEIILGSKPRRRALYQSDKLYLMCNYEQVLHDQALINQARPDVIILDEAQRIKNWRSKTAQNIKQLQSPFAFILTGTPIENRIDEIYSIMQFIDPAVFGPLFRFNRLYHELDDKGRPAGYKNLDKMHEQLSPFLLRRSKSLVEKQLPDCQTRTLMVDMSEEQATYYDEYQAKVGRLASIAKRRPLTPEEMRRLQIALACMRMVCDSAYILDKNARACPKLDEFREVLESLLQGDHKIIVFSEWIGMLDLVRGVLKTLSVGHARHTGRQTQQTRRREIRKFRQDPDCRVLLCTDSGGTGLNLQAADVVMNMDLPWNPAKLAQRVARAWRKHQTRPVTVFNFVTRNSIEDGMRSRLKAKQLLADGVLTGQLRSMALPSGNAAFLAQLDDVLLATEREAGSGNDPDTTPGDATDDMAEPAAAVDTSGNDKRAGDEATAPQTAAPSLEAFMQTMKTSLPELQRIDTVRTSDRTHLIITAPNVSAQQAEQPESGHPPLVPPENVSVELLSPEVSQAIDALVSAGILQYAGTRSSVVSTSYRERRQQRIEQQQSSLAGHMESVEAAQLLKQGGFRQQAETLLETTLQSLLPILRIIGPPRQDGKAAWDDWPRKAPTAKQVIRELGKLR